MVECSHVIRLISKWEFKCRSHVTNDCSYFQYATCNSRCHFTTLVPWKLSRWNFHFLLSIYELFRIAFLIWYSTAAIFLWVTNNAFFWWISLWIIPIFCFVTISTISDVISKISPHCCAFALFTSVSIVPNVGLFWLSQLLCQKL